ncbi:MAG: sigma-70 family RNA polymerase sigma factor [Armatimonadota bacterium]|nr:MAG: sigma-70 family RNA polymerase sigma factor [Armatimonadota bacterium]
MAEADVTSAELPDEREDTDRLVRGLHSADPAAHAELCRRFGRRLHRFAARRLRGDAELAEDIMVATLADAVRNIMGYNPRKAVFSAWLFGIARRHVTAELRRQSSRKSVPASAQVSMHSLPEQHASGDVAGDVTARMEAKRQVAMLREGLSEIEMEVLVLHCVDQLSLREIVQIVGRSERAIKSLLHRARQKARERLGADEH